MQGGEENVIYINNGSAIHVANMIEPSVLMGEINQKQ